MRADHKTEPYIDRAEALGRSGATYRQLDYWSRCGYIRVGQPGSGHLRQWADSEVEVARIITLLVTAGIVLDVAARVAREVAAGEVSAMLAPGVWIEVTA